MFITIIGTYNAVKCHLCILAQLHIYALGIPDIGHAYLCSCEKMVTQYNRKFAHHIHCVQLISCLCVQIFFILFLLLRKLNRCFFFKH